MVDLPHARLQKVSSRAVVNNSSARHIVVELARQGDPTAFLTLFSAEFENVYSSLCAQDGDTEDATRRSLGFARAVYRTFAKDAPRGAPDVWFRKQRQRCLPELPVLEDGDSLSTVAGDEFRDRLELLLQREHCAMDRRRSGHRARGGIRRWMQRHPVAAAAGIGAAAVIATIAVLQVVWSLGGTTLALEYRSGGTERTVVFPFGDTAHGRETAENDTDTGRPSGVSKADSSEQVAVMSPADGAEPEASEAVSRHDGRRGTDSQTTKQASTGNRTAATIE